jgi:Zn-dependent protease
MLQSLLDPAILISKVIILLICFPVHELAHAWTAEYLGDDTPRAYGRLSLNPLAHLDPIGSLLLIVSGFGWAKPVPINPYALSRRSSLGVLWVSLAGPLSNFVMAILGALPFRMGLVSINDIFSANQSLLPTVPQFLYEFIFINLILMLFNLIPLAPLDGEKVFDSLIPGSWSRALESIRPYSMLILLLLAVTGVLNILIDHPLTALLRLLLI